MVRFWGCRLTSNLLTIVYHYVMGMSRDNLIIVEDDVLGFVGVNECQQMLDHALVSNTAQFHKARDEPPFVTDSDLLTFKTPHGNNSLREGT